MDSVASELLSQIPVGDELKNPRAGVYESAVVKEVTHNDGDDFLTIVFTGMRDQEGNDFDHYHRVSFPTSNSEEWIQRQFLALLHDLGLVEMQDKQRRLVETPEVVEATVGLSLTLVGSSYSINLTENKKGFLNLYFQRQKRS